MKTLLDDIENLIDYENPHKLNHVSILKIIRKRIKTEKYIPNTNTLKAITNLIKLMKGG